MSSRATAEPLGSDVTYRNQANRVISWVGFYGLLVLTVSLDFLHMYSEFSDAPGDTTLVESLPLFGMVFLIAVLLLLLGARPYLRIHDGVLTIRNPLRTVCVPASHVDEVDESGKYLRLLVGGKVVTVWGMESWNAGPVGRVPTSLTVALQEGPAPGTVPPGDRMRQQLTPLRPAEAVGLLLWVAYAAGAAITTASGLSPATFS